MNKEERPEVGGNPINLHAILRQSLDAPDLMIQEKEAPWTTVDNAIESLPEKLYLLVDNGTVDFDFRRIQDNYVLSQQLYELVHQCTKDDITYIPLTVLSSDRKVLTTERYYCACSRTSYDVVDYQKSRYEEDLLLQDLGIKVVEKYNDLIIDNSIVPEVCFWTLEDVLLSTISVGISNSLAEQIENAGLDVTVIDPADFPTLYEQYHNPFGF